MNKNIVAIFCITLVLTTTFYASQDDQRNPLIATKKSEENIEDNDTSLKANIATAITQDDEPNTKSKKVNFLSSVSAILIPTRMEFVDAELIDHLWWSTSDCTSFRSDADQEMKDYATARNINIGTAIKELYQPETPTAPTPTRQDFDHEKTPS